MTPMQMAEECINALAEPSGRRDVRLVIPKGKTPRGFPRGELACETLHDGSVHRVLWYKPERLLNFLVKNGLITLEKTDNGYRVTAHNTEET